VPAAAVIPAPNVYIVIAAVKKLVVGSKLMTVVLHVRYCVSELFRRFSVVSAAVTGVVTLIKSM
jgi:hypothetical protein